MEKNDLHSDAKKVLEEADAAIKRSGMSLARRKFALGLLKAKKDLRKMKMVQPRSKRLR